MNAIILSIGNELLSGKTVNSNASYIGRKLYEIGIVVSEIQTIADDAAAIRNSLGRGLAQFDLVFITGGRGPTHDDITKKVVAEYFNAENTAWTATCLRMDNEGASEVIMPGVPAEMKAIMREHILPFLREKSGSVPLEVRQYRTTSIP